MSWASKETCGRMSVHTMKKAERHIPWGEYEFGALRGQ